MSSSSSSTAAQVVVSFEVGSPRVNPRGYTEYEVICSSNEILPGQLNSVTLRWTIWQRYSAWSSLDASLRRQYGLALDGCVLPPKQWFGTQEPEFMLQRARELSQFATSIQRRCRGLTNFGTHLGSHALANFLSYETRLTLAPLPVAARAVTSSSASVAVPVTGSVSGSAGSQRATGGVRGAQRASISAIYGGGVTVAPPIAAQQVWQMPSSSSSNGGVGAGAVAVNVVAPPRPTMPVVSTPAPVASRPPANVQATASTPPPPPPSQASPPPSSSTPKTPDITPGRSSLLDAIKSGSKLKKATTVDKSGPRV